MAEFQEVMRQKKRMCDSYKSCTGCPISESPNRRREQMSCTDFIYACPDIAEENIMKWAAEHPEPRYPTWREWHKAEFPDAGSKVSPCHFMSRDECCKGYHCRNCDIQPIPAHIAEKLGIKPIEED